MGRRQRTLGNGFIALALAAASPGRAGAEDPRSYWSYLPVQRPPVPALPQEDRTGAGWARNPIDAFIAAEHRKRGLTPRPPAEASVLLRRGDPDLIGLPPPRAGLPAVLADNPGQAHENGLGRPLGRPRCGPRWGRHRVGSLPEQH